MLRRTAATLGATALLVAALPQTAQAASSVTVTSPSCGTVKVANPTSMTYSVLFDSGDLVEVPARSSRSLTGLPGGDYTWIHGPSNSEVQAGTYLTVVARCAGGVSRPVDGDQNGDKLADVLGIQAGTGDLYYYQMTSTGLRWGVKAGWGWNRMVFMQQVNEIEGSGTGNYLLAVRDDGTLWRYDNLGYGKFNNGRQIGSGLLGYDNFTVTQLNNPLSFGGHMLLGRKGDVLYGWDLSATGLDGPYDLATGWGTTVKTIATHDFNGDNAGDLITIRKDGTMWSYRVDESPTATAVFTAPVQVGFGWGAMQTVTSPGSVNGDRLSDLIARRSDGNLYKYVNSGGRWNAAQQIGVSWNGIRLLA